MYGSILVYVDTFFWIGILVHTLLRAYYFTTSILSLSLALVADAPNAS